MREMEESTKDLPVTVTQFGKPIFTIVPVEEEKRVVLESTITKDIPPVVRCFVPMCKEPATEKGEIWDDVKGDLKEVPMCAKHAKRSRIEK